MPNYVKNVLTFKPGNKTMEDLIAFLDTLSSNKQVFDFEKLIPLHVSAKDPDACTKQSIGWGTKWNACDPKRTDKNEEIQIVFETAWNFPDQIFGKLMKISRFPFVWRYAEEQLCWDNGILEFNPESKNPLKCTRCNEDSEFAENLWNNYPSNGEYISIDLSALFNSLDAAASEIPAPEAA